MVIVIDGFINVFVEIRVKVRYKVGIQGFLFINLGNNLVVKYIYNFVATATAVVGVVVFVIWE